MRTGGRGIVSFFLSCGIWSKKVISMKHLVILSMPVGLNRHMLFTKIRENTIFESDLSKVSRE